MLLDTKICEYITPDSGFNSAAESYEFFLMWQAPDGSVNSWLFTDYVEKLQVNGQIINEQTTNINKIYSGAKNTITLTAEDLTENEFNTLTDILRAKIVQRILKNGTTQNVAIFTDSFEKQKSQQRYKFEFEIQLMDKPILK
jgi:hypothetical protein